MHAPPPNSGRDGSFSTSVQYGDAALLLTARDSRGTVISHSSTFTNAPSSSIKASRNSNTRHFIIQNGAHTGPTVWIFLTCALFLERYACIDLWRGMCTYLPYTPYPSCAGYCMWMLCACAQMAVFKMLQWWPWVQPWLTVRATICLTLSCLLLTRSFGDNPHAAVLPAVSVLDGKPVVTLQQRRHLSIQSLPVSITYGFLDK